MIDLTHRRREAEWMDRPGVDPALLERSLRFIRIVNRCLFYTRATLWHLRQFSRNWKPGERISIIDLATGSADVPLAILNWADRAGFDIRITAVDLHERTAQVARRASDDPRLWIVRADVLNLPFDPGSFDYAINSMFLHHLSDEDAVRTLSAMDCISRRGVIVADLLRHPRAYAWISLFTRFANPMVRHDALVSVAQAFIEFEILNLSDRAGTSYLHFHSHFAHRFVLAGEKI